MKNMTKKMFALLLSVVMMFAMAISVFAAESDQATVKTTANLNITKSADASNATFTAYKVMSAKQIGTDLFAYTVEDAFKPFFENGQNGYILNSDNEILKNGETTPVLTDGKWINTNSTVAADLASKLEKFAKANKIDEISVPANDLPIGYYLVSETTTSDKAQVSSKPVLVNLIADVNVTPKDSKTTLEKEILEGENKTPVKENTATIGDEIKYQVKTSIPIYAANVDKSKLVFKLSDTFTHLVYQKNLEIYAGADMTPVPVSDYNVTTNTDTEFVVEFTPDAILKYQGQDITLKYSATLGKDAVIGAAGNPNDIKLEYTYNPNQEKYKDTLDDKVKTYTYGFKIHKVDKNNETKDMAGAKFQISDEKGTVLGTFTYGENGTIKEVEGSVVIEGGDVNFASIKGLKAGKYSIKEIQAPQGYSMLANDVVVVIEGLVDADGNLNGKSELKLDQGSQSNDAVIEVGKSSGDNTVDMVVKIFNVKGISLPETGAKTAMYCLMGGVLLLVLGGLYFGFEKLSTRKRQ